MVKKEICARISSVKISNFNRSTGMSVTYHDRMDVTISNFDHSTGMNVIYHDQMDIVEQAALPQQQIFWWECSFNQAFWPELASPWPPGAAVGHRARNSDSTSIYYYEIRELKKTFKFNR